MIVRYTSPAESDQSHAKLEDQEAIDLLVTGTAILSREQSNPPFALLDILEERVSDKSVFGLPTNDPKLLNTISTKVFANGVRQSVVEGIELLWFKSGREFAKAAEEYASQCREARQNLFYQAHSVLSTYISDASSKVARRAGFTDEDMRHQSLVKGRTRMSEIVEWVLELDVAEGKIDDRRR